MQAITATSAAQVSNLSHAFAPSFVLYPVTLAFAAFDCASDYTLIRETAALEVPQMHRAGPDALRHLVAWRMARQRWRDAPCGFNL